MIGVKSVFGMSFSNSQVTFHFSCLEEDKSVNDWC